MAGLRLELAEILRAGILQGKEWCVEYRRWAREPMLHGNFELQDITVGRTLAGFPETQSLQKIVP